MKESTECAQSGVEIETVNISNFSAAHIMQIEPEVGICDQNFAVKRKYKTESMN